jgi:hypothetical protein
MACDGTRVFVVGGALSEGRQVAETKLIHVLDTSMYSFCHFIGSAFKPVIHRAPRLPGTRLRRCQSE